MQKRKELKKPLVFVFKNAPMFNDKRGEVKYSDQKFEVMPMNLRTFIEAICINERLMNLDKGTKTFIHHS